MNKFPEVEQPEIPEKGWFVDQVAGIVAGDDPELFRVLKSMTK